MSVEFHCRYCTAPKRYPGCHGSCPEYLADRAEYDRLKKDYDRERDIGCAIENDRAKKVYNAMKNRRRKNS